MNKRARIKLQRVIFPVFGALTLFLSITGIVFASDISSANYLGLITITNNSTAASAVSTNMTLSSTDLISQGWVDTNFTRSAMRNTSGADVPYMPGYGSNPWALWVPAINANSSINYNLYFGTSDMSSTKYWFPAAGGGTVNDHASMEPSSNFTMTWDGWFDTTAGASKNLVSKTNALSAFVSPTVSGNITAEIYPYYYSSTSDGRIYATNVVYNTAWTAATGTVDSANLYVGQATGFYVFRGFLFFDTSSIPDSATITSATLSLYGATDFSATNFDVVVTNGQPTYPHDPMAIGDYDKTNYSGSGGSFNTGTFTTTGYNNITLNATGISWISKTGTTKLTLRSSLDIAGTSPAGDEYVVFYPAETAGTSQDPVLVVTYTPADYAVSATGVTSAEHTAILTKNTYGFMWWDIGKDSSVTVPSVTDNLVLNLPLWSNNLNWSSFASVDSNKFNATVTNATWGSQGRTFSGSGKITIPALSSTLPSPFTINLWAYRNWDINDSYGVLIGQYAGDATGFLIDGGNAANRIRFVGNPGAGEYAVSWSSSVSGTTFYNITVLHDGTNLNLYLNGVLYNSSVRGAITAGTASLDIGGIAAAGYSHSTIGDVFIYNRALSPDEITQLYNDTKWRYIGAHTGDAFDYAYTSSVLDNANNYLFSENYTMPYVEYIEMTKGGNQVAYWDWDYGTTFDDQSANSNTMTPTFRTTTSDADVSAVLASFAPIDTATAPAYAVSDAPLFITAPITASSNFTSGNVSGSGIPGSALVESVSQSSGTPNIWLWGIIGGLTIGLAGLFISYMVKEHGGGSGEIFLRMGVAIIIMGVMVAFGKYDFWMLVLYVFIALAPAMASRFGDFGGSVNEINLIGYLSMSWVGLTIINRIQEAQLLTSAETSHLNTLMFTQEMTVAGSWKLPILNFDFFTQGIAGLLRMDNAMFGGNAQLFQYMLYSLNAVIGFIILGLVLGMLTSNVIRARG